MGIARSSEYPEVQRVKEEPNPDMNEIKALPAPETAPPPPPSPPPKPQHTGDLVDLREEAGTTNFFGNNEQEAKEENAPNANIAGLMF
ncbi:hypothetical protein L1987_02536 [Smallanthus sonchifolius]|uniref:Uncharacterized protein n=1 Tax=Smallanthus sonchifolius TaxID=185202 RepID=A0ACB9K810_9ASTR|nr:hypothetical protein L1987_02536 [Smallanthus sonchifolius]